MTTATSLATYPPPANSPTMLRRPIGNDKYIPLNTHKIRSNPLEKYFFKFAGNQKSHVHGIPGPSQLHKYTRK